jgi:hypothetical protein
MIALAKPVSTDDLIHAIELACSPVLGSLNMANALGGTQTDTWRLVREFTLVQLIDEACERGIDLTTIKAACCDLLVMDTPPFRGAVGYDPRPRCGLCNRRHYVDKRYIDERRSGEPLSCGDSQRFRNPPADRWSKPTMIAAVEGTYQP